MPDGAYETCKLSLSPGGFLLVVSEGVCAAFEEQGRQFGDQRMIEALLPRLGGSADEIVECLRDQLEGCAASGRYDRTILAAKCRVGRQSERQLT